MLKAGTFRFYGGLTIMAASAAFLIGEMYKPVPAEKPHPYAVCEAMRVVSPSGREIRAELALTQAEQSRGLSGRTELDPAGGMLFVFHSEREAAFWMRDTLIPLDLIFFNGAGEPVTIIRDASPETNTLLHSGVPVMAVLETVPGVWSDAELEGKFGFDCVRPPGALSTPEMKNAG